ncbi:ABC transporter family substrate-binding protein [Cellulomonas sp. P22]|uniref:ABC transporter family substrate-binding protein n=1 Tax=Cellulomonas sp. P22 TaxID=3373189 RepID=UPI0037960707
MAAVAAVGALVLGACSSTPKESTIDEATSINVGWNQAFYSQNNLTSSGNATANANIIYLTTSTFYYYDGDLNLKQNEGVGSYEVVSEDPFTVKYTVNEGVTWSDGTAVDAADLMLWWGAQNGAYNNVEPEYDDEGNVTNQDVVDAGVYFNGESEAMKLVTETPVIGDDGRSLTLKYDEPRSDWEVSFNLPPVAAHAVASLGLGIDDPAKGKQAIIDAFTNADATALSGIAKAWNTGFDFTSLPDNKLQYLSSGPYVMTDFVENEYLTLELRDDYDWGPIPKVDSITIRYNEDPLAQVTALQNGELDIIAPQSSVDVLATLNGIEGVKVEGAPEGSYEHVDLQFTNGGPFDPATYGGDAEKARKVREAFLKTIPRQEILEKLIVPLQADAKLRDSFIYVPGSAAYDEVVAGNGSEKWADVDIEGAKALLAEVGVPSVDVRLLFGQGNVRRENQYQLIAASAAQAGFNVINASATDWGNRLDGDTTGYDAALFAWQSTNTFALNSEANYITGGNNNFYGYSNADVDAWFTELGANTDPKAETALVTKIEKQLNDDAFGVSIFQFPGVVASRDVVKNVSTISLSPTIFWNFWEWELSA